MANAREVVIKRYFDQPREAVWRAWADPEMLKAWWGPEGFTSPECEMDFQVGGEYLHCMQGPDGKRYYDAGVFKEIVPLQKIVYTDSFADENGDVVPASYYGMSGEWPEVMEVKVVFSEIVPGKTKMTLTHYGIPEEMRDECSAGWDQSFNKLEESLEQGEERYLKAA